MAERISIGSLSETWPAAARQGLDAPLIVERSIPALTEHPRFLELIETSARSLAGLPAPFRRIVEVRRADPSIEIIQERFVGLSSQQLVSALRVSHRLLPLDVWLGLADALCRAWGSVPQGEPAWRLVPTMLSFGVDVRRRVVLFPEPDHSIDLNVDLVAIRGGPLAHQRHEHASPEHLRQNGSAVGERSRVFSFATVLVELLTLDRPFRRTTYLHTLQATFTGDARWRAANHPECPRELGQVLARALSLSATERPASLEALRAQLVEAAGCEPASPERISRVVLGVEPEAVRRTLATLRAQPAFLPASWREGGLDVLEDQLLESLVPLEQLPLSRAPAREPSSPRVNLGPAPASAGPRVNLAAARRPWWWPFGRR